MSNLRAKLEAKRLAKLAAASTTTKPSLENETPVKAAPEQPVKEVVKTEAVKQVAQVDKVEPKQVAQKPRIKRVAGGLIKAAIAKQTAEVVATSASDIAAKAAQLAQGALDTKPKEEAPTQVKPKLGVGKRTSGMANESAKMIKDGAIMAMGAEQVEQLEAIEGLHVDDFMESLYSLEAYLVEDVPSIATLQQQTHKNLRQYPELCHILSDAQVGVVVQGIAKRRNIEIVSPTTGSKAKTNVKNLTRNLTAEELLDEL